MNWKLIQEGSEKVKELEKQAKEIASLKEKLSKRDAELSGAVQAAGKRKATFDHAKGQLEAVRTEKDELLKQIGEHGQKEGELLKIVSSLKATVEVKEAALAKAVNTAEARHKVLILAKAQVETLRKEKEAQSRRIGEQSKQHEQIIKNMTDLSE